MLDARDAIGSLSRYDGVEQAPHPNPLPQGEREIIRCNLPPLPLRERVGVRGNSPLHHGRESEHSSIRIGSVIAFQSFDDDIR
jgi:hypothetical protein